MSFSKKPQDITQFIVDQTEQMNTWQFAGSTRLSSGGVNTEGRSIDSRRLREARRQSVGVYGTSSIANTPLSNRGEVSKFTKNERRKLDGRVDSIQPPGGRPTPPTPPVERSRPDASLYRRPQI